MKLPFDSLTNGFTFSSRRQMTAWCQVAVSLQTMVTGVCDRPGADRA